jgi:hypothetical protein
MDDSRKGRRLYSDTEIGTLIQRATEIQEAQKESSERGLSLQELEQIAAEIGIDPQHFRAAALELESGMANGARFRLWGGPFVLNEKRVVQGTLTGPQWEHIVQGLRRLTRSEGRITEIGRIREWSREIKDLDYTMQRTSVTISPREDQATIEVQTHYRGGAAAAYTLGVVLGGALAGIFLDGSGVSDLMSGIILAGSGLGGLGAARAAIGYWAKRQRRQLRRLTDFLQDAISHPQSLEPDDQRLVGATHGSEEPALPERIAP